MRRAADRVFTMQPRVLIDNNASDTFTVIEVNGRDRPSPSCGFRPAAWRTS
jgi:UTP:GlnB (protein PII) uridylyltransferase